MLILIRRGNLENKGAEAMLRTVRAELSRRLPDAEFGVLTESFAGRHLQRVRQLGFRVVDSAIRRGEKIRTLIGSGPRLLGPALAGDRDRLNARAILSRCAALIDISGYAYGDPWGKSRAVRTSVFTREASRLGMPRVFMPQTWGPFEEEGDRSVYRDMLCGAAVYARDHVSRRHLGTLLGRPPEEIPIKPDIAFRFPASDPAAGLEILRRHRIDPDEPLAVVCPSRKVYTDTRASRGGAYFGVLLGVVRQLRERGFAVAVLPHEIAAGGERPLDDRVLCEAVAGAAGDPKVAAVTDVDDAAELKAVIARASAVVSSRFHCLVASLSSGVPSVALGWSHKYHELLEPFGLADRSIDVTEGGAVAIRKALADSLEGSDSTRARIREVAESHRVSIQALFDEVCREVRGRD